MGPESPESHLVPGGADGVCGMLGEDLEEAEQGPQRVTVGSRQQCYQQVQRLQPLLRRLQLYKHIPSGQRSNTSQVVNGQTHP